MPNRELKRRQVEELYRRLEKAEPARTYEEAFDLIAKLMREVGDALTEDPYDPTRWKEHDRICITEVRDDSVLDDEPSYVVHSVDDALQIVIFLLGAGMATDLHGVDDPARKAA